MTPRPVKYPFSRIQLLLIAAIFMLGWLDPLQAPVLIALAFRETELLKGILLFSMIVGLGLGFRFYLERLRLLLVPRLTTVLTVVVILMAGISVLSQKLELQPGLSIALFPMVILAMTIERMSIVWEEHGPADAIKQGIGSLIVAAGCYLLMFDPRIEPEPERRSPEIAGEATSRRRPCHPCPSQH